MRRRKNTWALYMMARFETAGTIANGEVTLTPIR